MANALELFDTFNRVNFPTDAQIAAMSAEAQASFKPVRAAKDKLDAATKFRVKLDQQIVGNDASRLAVATELTELRPKWTETDNIKAHIRSEQEQRRIERGY
jgi:hypothetical protein